MIIFCVLYITENSLVSFIYTSITGIFDVFQTSYYNLRKAIYIDEDLSEEEDY